MLGWIQIGIAFFQLMTALVKHYDEKNEGCKKSTAADLKKFAKAVKALNQGDASGMEEHIKTFGLSKPK